MKPDHFQLNGGNRFKSLEPLSQSNDNGDWYWDNTTSEVSFIIINKFSTEKTFTYNIRILKCFFVDCIVPKIPNNLPITSSQKPDEILLWSDPLVWKEIAEPGYGGYYGNNQFGPPRELDKVKIPIGKYLLVDTPLPKLTSLEVEGYLELSPNISHKLEVENLVIRGGQLIIGWEDQPILTDVEIKLSAYYEAPGSARNRHKRSMTISDPDDPAQLQVYGGLDIHGKPHNITWTRLSVTALRSTNEITLIEAVDWEVGETVVISSTANSGQDEVRIIGAVSLDMTTLRLTQSLSYDHLVGTEMFDSGNNTEYKGPTEYHIAARVGLLSRNVKIVGNDSIGGSLLVGEKMVYYYKGVLMPRKYKGFARISNVEFINMGKKYREGSGVGKADAAIKFYNLGQDIRTSYFIKNSINGSNHPGVIVEGSANIRVEDNFLYKTNDFGIWAFGSNASVKRNMVVGFTGGKKPKTGAIQFPPGIKVEENFISSATKGYWFDGENCAAVSSLTKNTIYASGFGVVVFKKEGSGSSCIKIVNFIAVHCDLGIYFMSSASFKAESNILVGNSKGVFSYAFGPAPLTHIFANQYLQISNNLIVANSQLFKCSSSPKIGVLWPILASSKLMNPYVKTLFFCLILS